MGAPSYRPPPLSNSLVHASKQCSLTTKNEREREAQSKHSNPQPTTTRKTSDVERKKKKHRSGRKPWCRWRPRSRGRRWRSWPRKHKGKSKPKRFGFPQRLREKEETRNTASTKPTIQKKKRGTHTRSKYGSGLEGLKNQTNYQPQRQKRETNNQMTKTKTGTEKQTQEPYTSLGICLPQGGGAHGPLCLLLRSHRRGP